MGTSQQHPRTTRGLGAVTQLLSQLPQPSATVDAETRISHANGAFLDLVSREAETCIGLPLAEIVGDFELGELDRGLQQAREQGSAEITVYLSQSRSTARFVAARFSNAGGPSVALIAVDSAAHPMMAVMEQRERLLREAERVGQMGSWEWEIDTGHVSWSDEMYRIYGYEPGEIRVGYETVVEHTIPADRTTMHEAIDRALSTQQPEHYVHRIRRPDGEERDLSSGGRVTAVNPDGTPLRMIGICRDITAETAVRKRSARYRRMLRQERAANAQLREYDDLKTALLSALSHDLRVPATSVVASLQTLRDLGPQLEPDVAGELVERAAEQARQVDRLVGDLLDLERLRRSQITAVVHPTAIGELVRHVLDGIGVSDHVEFAVDGTTEQTDDVIAEVEPAKVERIVDTLVRNALRHSPQPGSVRVHVRAFGSDDVFIAVDDRGPGVPDSLKASVFRMFDGGNHLENDGAGVGLAIVERFAQMHGGQAWVEDRHHGGASFRVLLPRRSGRTANEHAPSTAPAPRRA